MGERETFTLRVAGSIPAWSTLETCSILGGEDMTIAERILHLSGLGADIEMITMILRSEGITDSDIRAGYDEVASHTDVEIIRGQFYIRR